MIVVRTPFSELVGDGACRGRGWKTVPGFPISKGYKSKSGCEKDCKRTIGCTAYDVARKKGNKWDCHLFGHGNVIANSKIRGICHKMIVVRTPPSELVGDGVDIVI